MNIDKIQLIYFFSRHKPSPLMLEHLGGAIIQQFYGTIANVKRVGDAIAFDETIEQEIYQHQISADSIVVAVAPITLQVAWLQAGVVKLLIPQTRREVDGKGGAIFTYTGLKWIKAIAVDSEQFVGVDPTIEEMAQVRDAFVS